MLVLILLLVFAFFVSVNAGQQRPEQSQQPCFIKPPYRRIAVVKLSIDSHHQLWSELRLICELRFINDDNVHEDAVLLTPKQLYHAQSNLPSSKIKILLPDLLTHLSNHDISITPFSESTTTATTNIAQYRSLHRNTLDPSFHHKLRPLVSHEQRWKHIAQLFSRDVRLEKIGKTTEKRDLYLLRIGRTSLYEPKRVLLIFGQHAREWASVASATYVAEVLARHPQPGIEILIVPLANPDGYHYSTIYDRLWRKNRARAAVCNISAVHSGVDLNRNWGVDFAGNQSTTSDPCSPIYHGRRAFSEPETAAIRRINITGIRAFLDVHSYSQLLIGPWAYSTAPPPRAPEIDEIGRRLQTAASTGGSPYSYGRGSFNGLYLASGVASDWYFKQGALASFTLELRPERTDPFGFEIRPDQILPTAKDALNVARELIAYAGGTTTIRRPRDGSGNTGWPIANGSSVSADETEPTRPKWILPTVLGVVGSVVVIVVIFAFVFVLRRRNANSNESDDDNNPESANSDESGNTSPNEEE